MRKTPSTQKLVDNLGFLIRNETRRRVGSSPFPGGGAWLSHTKGSACAQSTDGLQVTTCKAPRTAAARLCMRSIWRDDRGRKRQGHDARYPDGHCHGCATARPRPRSCSRRGPCVRAEERRVCVGRAQCAIDVCGHAVVRAHSITLWRTCGWSACSPPPAALASSATRRWRRANLGSEQYESMGRVSNRNTGWLPDWHQHRMARDF